MEMNSNKVNYSLSIDFVGNTILFIVTREHYLGALVSWSQSFFFWIILFN